MSQKALWDGLWRGDFQRYGHEQWYRPVAHSRRLYAFVKHGTISRVGLAIMAETGTQNILSTRQRRAIAALLTARNIRDAAKTVGIPERTVARWLADDPDFRLALLAAEGDAIDAATRRLVSLSDAAIATLEDTMTSAGPAGIKLRAAQSVLDYLLRLRELRNIEQRLTALEAMSYGKQ